MINWKRAQFVAVAIAAGIAGAILATSIRGDKQHKAFLKVVELPLAPTHAPYRQLLNIPATAKIVVPTTKTECLKENGFWGPQGLPGGPSICSLKTADNRKICTNSNQCQGQCLVASDMPLGTEAIGSCDAWDHTYGCYKFLDGVKVAQWCGE
ncbi:MAG: hypothetical protein ABIQ97_04190 [Lysobacteraceae bacterium]